MRVLLIGPNYFNYVRSIATSLEKINITVNVQCYGNAYDSCSYWQKKLDYCGIIDVREAHASEWNHHILEISAAFKPDVCIVCNGTIMSSKTLQFLKSSGAKLVLWLLDGLKRNSQLEQNLSFYDRCFVYDVLDIDYVTQKYQVSCSHVLSSYDSSIYYPDKQVRDVDISFVGKTTKKRMEILKQVADYALKNNRTFITYGNYWGSHFWKKSQFKKKHAPLDSYAVNAKIDPGDLAGLYRRSKICLNIHIAEHDGLNPRTFEILGTKSFALVDNKAELNQYFQIGKHLAVYNDIDDLLEKIDYYLLNSDLREAIAAEGYAHVENTYDIDSTVQRVWSLIVS
jgi:spore maturation protein CgeB